MLALVYLLPHTPATFVSLLQPAACMQCCNDTQYYETEQFPALQLAVVV
jgi:hypothetical protein